MSHFSRNALIHGSLNEANGIATLCAKVLPAFFPTLTFHEEGCVMLEHVNGEPFMIVSPDGCAKDNATGTNRMAIEIKCPVSRTQYMNASDLYHDLVPTRHICQILSEMKALDCSQLLFVRYMPPPGSTTVFLAKFDAQLWEVLFQHSLELWGREEQKRPMAEHPDTEKINLMLDQYSCEKIEVLAEVPSLTATGIVED